MHSTQKTLADSGVELQADSHRKTQPESATKPSALTLALTLAPARPVVPLRIYKVTPVAGEPTRYWVPSESEPHAPPFLVDLDDDGVAHCSCQIIHNRTEANAECKHIRAVLNYRHETR